jgi:hypothetical protein
MLKRLFIILVVVPVALAQYAPRSFEIAGRSALDDATPEPRLVSNVIIDILPQSADTLWLGTGNGVTRLLPGIQAIPEDPISPTFQTYTQEDGLGKGGVSGLYVGDSIIWTAFAFDTSVGVSGAGGGLDVVSAATRPAVRSQSKYRNGHRSRLLADRHQRGQHHLRHRAIRQQYLDRLQGRRTAQARLRRGLHRLQ